MSSLATKSVNFGGEKSNPRRPNTPISKITIHHMAGNCNPENAAYDHLNGNRDVSANYYIGTDGTIVSGVSENRRSWASSNKDNDYAAITIEVANNSGAPQWTVSDAAYNSLINLCVDICRRYNITLNYTGNSNGTLTCHDMFKSTECPGPYLKSKLPEISNIVNQRK